jgi:hypothetical protein
LKGVFKLLVFKEGLKLACVKLISVLNQNVVV